MSESNWGVPWPHRLAWATAGATVFLLFVGGLVTSLRVGLAVPDWPTTFGYNMFLFPWSGMVGGVFYEHSHRLIASAVGLLTVFLAASLWLWERRRWVRWLGAAALLLVVFQGVIGGLRVVLLEVAFAILHACFAQAFFALAVSLALFTSDRWPARSRWMSREEAVPLRTLCVSAALVIYVQGILGALVRHIGTMLMPHLFVAGMMVVLVSWLGERVWRHRVDHPELWRPAALLCGLVLAQILLGSSSYLGKFWTWLPVPVVVVLTTFHMVSGALAFATAVVLTVRCYRLPAPADFVGALGSVLAPAPGASQRTAS
ncbi:MAG: COX15/CtaA family protein [Deltaproteobacteria bacterium]|nr:COX15/CtaA family protein [Deltaproteobacteria bacterium]